ncbi:tetratricopeptide repeat-containing sensor histidine kinase [Flavobacterium cerinum]|uniref:histidine kinase n=1 Tax=Flavobacterium cerinum TaxID=2502784 RepID=A0ABY5IQB4_9FLAO|nr:tetratricopeptide repeat-containing sensor histidine kinase [Flavobacterium cerinum]UUC45027.1 tetratricopeptide repeat protein [Flavobacterium cerinum]
MKNSILLVVFLYSSLFWSQNQKSSDSTDYYLNRHQELNALRYLQRESESLYRDQNYTELCQKRIRKAHIYIRLKDYSKAIDILFNTLQIAEKKQLHLQEAIILKHIGVCFEQTKNIKQAVYYLRKSEKCAYSQENDSLSAWAQQGLFKIFAEKNNLDSARFYMKRILDIAKNNGTNQQKYVGFSNYAAYYLKTKEYDRAKQYLDTTLFYAEASKNLESLNNTRSNIAYYYLQVKKDYQKAEAIFLQILASKPNDTISLSTADTYLNLSYVYEKMQDYKKANAYLNKYIDNTEALFNERVSSELRDTETKYKIYKIEDTYKTKEQLLKDKEARNKKLLYIFITLFAFCSILFYFFYQNMRLKQKNKLKDVNNKIQQNIINATIDGQEFERKRLAGILHDSISALLSSASLHLMAYETNHVNEASPELTKTKAIIKEAHDKIRDLSHTLIPPVLEKLGLLAALQDLCEKNSNTLMQFEFTNHIAKDVRYNSDFEMKMYFIVAELLNNIIKHSQASKAYISVEQSQNQLFINVEDNGVGFDTKTTEHKEGFGLTQIKARIRSMHGSININSKSNTGTLIYIKVELPD